MQRNGEGLNIYIYIYTYIYICTYIYMYIYIYTHSGIPLKAAARYDFKIEGKVQQIDILSASWYIVEHMYTQIYIEYIHLLKTKCWQ